MKPKLQIVDENFTKKTKIPSDPDDQLADLKKRIFAGAIYSYFGRKLIVTDINFYKDAHAVYIQIRWLSGKDRNIDYLRFMETYYLIPVKKLWLTREVKLLLMSGVYLIVANIYLLISLKY